MTATLEEVEKFVLDEWGTLNTVTSPGRLPKGQSPNNQNVWVDEKLGSVVTSNGIFKLGETPSGNPSSFCFDYFRTSDGSHSFIVSDGTTIWTTTDFVNFTEIVTGLASFFQLRAIVVRDKLWITNGSDSVMTWDGTTLTNLDGTASTPNVPRAKYIAYHDERVWLYGISGDTSNLAFSELSDSAGTVIAPDNASAWPTSNRIQISEGDADIGTGIFVYRGYLFCSKQYSIWRIVGYDRYTYSRVKTRAHTGTRFAESIRIVDNLVEFIGVDGFYVFDGEETKRVSDLIDPATPEQGTFAFRNLQQPLLNTNFLHIHTTAEWNTGTSLVRVSGTADKLALIAADDDTGDFAAGDASNNIDFGEEEGTIRLERGTTGVSSESHSASQPCHANLTSGQQIGTPANLTDENSSTLFGLFGGAVGSTTTIVVSLDEFRTITNVRLNSVFSSGGLVTVMANTDSNTYTLPPSGSAPALPASFVTQGTITVPAGSSGAVLSLQFSAVQASQIALVTTMDNFQIADVNVYSPAFELSGKFISRVIDYVEAPTSYGTLSADIDANGETYQFFSQSSVDGVVWSGEANITEVNQASPIGGVITSPLRRYFRWGVYLTSAAGLNTPVISTVFVGGSYISLIQDTGGSLIAYGALEAVQNKLGQVTNIYYRTGATEADVLLDTWTAIVPGAVPSGIDRYIQIRIEMSTTDVTLKPFFSSITVNWLVSTAAGVNTLQNVASFVWLNRYWLAAATIGAESNDIVIVRGKSTSKNPWQRKDFSILSFCRYNDLFIGCSSLDGSIYRMEYGYSKAGEALDSFFETGDYSASGFMLQLYEMLVTADRSGPYDLSVGVSIDGGETWTEKTMDLTRDTGASLSTTKKFNINFMSDAFRVRVRTNAADQPFAVDEIRVFYRLLPTRGSLN